MIRRRRRPLPRQPQPQFVTFAEIQQQLVRQVKMAVFDALPPEVRHAINYATVNKIDGRQVSAHSVAAIGGAAKDRK